MDKREVVVTKVSERLEGLPDFDTLPLPNLEIFADDGIYVVKHPQLDQDDQMPTELHS
jgi:hypothetical protein